MWVYHQLITVNDTTEVVKIVQVTEWSHIGVRNRSLTSVARLSQWHNRASTRRGMYEGLCNYELRLFCQKYKQEVKVIWQKAPHGGGHSPVRGHARGSKFVPLNSWGRGSYLCSIVTIGLGCTVWPQCTRVTTNDQRRHDTAYLNKRLFY